MLLGLASVSVSVPLVIEATFNDRRKAENPAFQMQFTARLYHERFRRYFMFCTDATLIFRGLKLQVNFNHHLGYVPFLNYLDCETLGDCF